jgi:hypothetical protein
MNISVLGLWHFGCITSTWLAAALPDSKSFMAEEAHALVGATRPEFHDLSPIDIAEVMEGNVIRDAGRFPTAPFQLNFESMSVGQVS